MDCKQCRERLHDFLDETLEAAERAQVSAHVADCAACRRELEELRKAAALVSSLDELPEPAGFLQAVRERIARPTLWERFEGLLTQPLRPGVSVGIPVIIVAFIAVFVVMNLPPRSPRRAEKADEAWQEERVEIAYDLEQAPSPSGAEETESWRRPKGGPSEEAAEPTEGFAVGKSRSAGDKEEEEALGDTDAALEKASTTDGVAKGDEAAGELEAGTEVANRDVTEGTQLDRTLEAGQRARAGATTATAEGTTATRGQQLEDGDKADAAETDRAGTDLAEAEEDEAAGAEGELAEGADVETEEAKQVANESLFFGVGGPRGDLKDSNEQVIQLVVFDLPTDISNVQQIADEEGGQLVERRERDALTGLVVQVPTSNYARTVQKLSVYNKMNWLAVEQEKDQSQDQTIRNKRAAQLAKGKQRLGWLKPLPLIVQRIVEQAPADE